MPTAIARIGRRLLSMVTRFDRHQRGSAAVEFGLIAAPFFGCMFAIIEVALVFFAGQVLDTAVADASRLILTGQAQNQGFALADFRNRICTNAVQTLFNCNNIALDVRSASSFSSANLGMPTNPVTGKLDTSGFGYNTTVSCDIVIVRAIYEWPTLALGFGFKLTSAASSDPNHNYIMMSTVAFRNEPYSGSGWCGV
jgi:Flp pilus assembly protein TadG